jgi:hypothetical protein
MVVLKVDQHTFQALDSNSSKGWPEHHALQLLHTTQERDGSPPPRDPVTSQRGQQIFEVGGLAFSLFQGCVTCLPFYPFTPCLLDAPVVLLFTKKRVP